MNKQKPIKQALINILENTIDKVSKNKFTEARFTKTKLRVGEKVMIKKKAIKGCVNMTFKISELIGRPEIGQ